MRSYGSLSQPATAATDSSIRADEVNDNDMVRLHTLSTPKKGLMHTLGTPRKGVNTNVTTNVNTNDDGYYDDECLDV